jgi:large subunit ribosomal protein L30
MAKALQIKQTRGLARCKPAQKKTMKALGLRGIGKSVLRADLRAIRGMLNTVHHLVEVEQVEAGKKIAAPKQSRRGIKVG